MKKITVVVETSLEPHHLEVVLQEAVVRQSGFISKVEVQQEFQKSYKQPVDHDLETRHQSKLDQFKIRAVKEPPVTVMKVREHHLPSIMPEACNIGGG